MIEKLEQRSGDGLYYEDGKYPTDPKVINKINELIDVLNELEKKNTENLPKNMKTIKNKKELAILIDEIIKIGAIEGRNDSEEAHIIEDKLHLHLIEQFCPDWVKKEIKRLNDADFSRWYS